MEEAFSQSVIIKLAAKKNKKNKEKTETPKKEKEITTETGKVDNNAEAKQLNLDWSNPSWDMFLLAFFVIGSLLYGVSLGKDRIIAILVSIYMALAVVNALPEFILNISFNDNFTLQITAFISVFVVLFFLLSRSAVFTSLDVSGQGKWWQVIIFSVLHVGLLISVAMSFMPEVFIDKFADITKFVFTNEWTQFGWIMAPIVAMVVFGKRDDN